MTQGEKARAYDKAIERAKAMIKVAANQDEARGFANTIFPELAESEDKKIMKEIAEFIYNTAFKPKDIKKKEKWLAWLEKQGEQKYTDTDNKFIRMRETKPKDISEFLDRLTTVEQEFLWEHIAKIRELDKEEQTPTDKIEPIFNVGDKIQYLKGCGTIMTIEKIENGEYIFANNMGHTTIENGNKCYLVERKPAEWHREDEQNLNACLGYIPDEFLRRWLKDVVHAKYDPQNTWKPSDEQMMALWYHCSNGSVLSSLYNDLNKLKEGNDRT